MKISMGKISRLLFILGLVAFLSFPNAQADDPGENVLIEDQMTDWEDSDSPLIYGLPEASSDIRKEPPVKTFPHASASEAEASEKTAEDTSPHVFDPAEKPSGDAKPHVWPADESAGGGVPEVTEIEMEPQESPLSQKERLKQVEDVNFKAIDLRQALSILAETYDLNILIDEEVRGTVAVNFESVTLAEALKQMLELKGFTYKWEGNIIKIIKAEEDIETRAFYVNHINLDLAKEVIVDELSKDGKIKLNIVTNQLIITDTTTKLDEIKKMISGIDTPPLQVRIETKLIDISHTDLNNLGVSWEGADWGVKIPRWLGLEKKTKLTASDYTNPGTSATLDGGQFVFSFAQFGGTMTATVDALIRNTKARVIANPSITALNNVEARITIGTKYPIREQTQTSTGTLETTRFVDIGTTLKVTPKINQDGTIQMAVHPEVSSVSSTVDAGPVITTREADTTVIINDGDTLIIAGLLSTLDDSNRSRIPILGSLPIIGHLFSSQDKDKEQKELVIFMTPHVLDVSGGYLRYVEGRDPSEVVLAGERVSAVELFTKAEDLVAGKSLQARAFPYKTRVREAARLYQRISTLYPDNYYAQISLYRAGRLFESKLKEKEDALWCYGKILESYPKSAYAPSAKKRIKKLTAKR